MRRAGLRKHHKAAYWGQGQGFPKSARIDTQVDKAAGAEREVIGVNPNAVGRTKNKTGGNYGNDQLANRAEVDLLTAPATPLARTWAGHRYGLQAIKPSAESVLIFQKPYAGRPVDSITGTGAGALWIEGGRIGLADWDSKSEGGRTSLTHGSDGPVYGKGCGGGGNNNRAGRWPANLLLSHVPPHPCPDCDGDGCEACGGEGLVGGCVRVGEKEVSGTCKPYVRSIKADSDKYGTDCGTKNVGYKTTGYAGSDGKEVVADWRCVEGWLLTPPEPCPYCGAEQDFIFSTKDGVIPWGTVVGFDSYEVKCRECQEQYDFELPDVTCPVRQLGEQSGERRSGGRNLKHSSDRGGGYEGGWKPQDIKNFHPGDTGTAARFFFQADWSHEIAEQIERAAPVFYCAKASRRERDAGLDGFEPKSNAERENRQMGNNSKGSVGGSGKPINGTGFHNKPRNHHATVKPIALAKHLATLLLPPPEYAPRRILVPFCGSGSEMIGAMLAGWEEIVGIDIVPDYCAIAEARLAWWADWLAYTGVDDVKELLRLSNNGKVRKAKEAERLV